MTNDIIVKLIDFPTSAKEAVTKNEDGTYTIFINAKLSHEMQLESYAHALAHIDNGDYDNDCDVDVLEMSAHYTY